MKNFKLARLLLLGLWIILGCHRAVVAAEDWPMWRADSNRSAATSNTVPESVDLLWTVDMGARTQAWDDPLNLDLMTYDRAFEPIVLGSRMFLGFNDQSKLVALDTTTGEKLWTFFTEGPVRLAPVGWQDKLYFCSDDGFLYCVQADSGELEWKFSGAPNAQHAIGNRKLTSAWPARGGPVIYDDHVYFAASIWPFMGTFLFALDADTGGIVWVNDSTGAQYIKQPHSAPSFAGVAPQGALVATDDLLVVPGGRSVPAVFDRHTGELQYFEINAGGKGTGGSFVAADENHFYVHTRDKGTRAFHLETGLKTAFVPNEPVLAGDVLYAAELAGEQPVVRAYDVRKQVTTAIKPLWEVPAAGSGDLILAGSSLLAASGDTISRINLSPQGMPAAAEVIATTPTDESIVRLLVADQKLFAVTDSGKIMAFGERSAAAPAQTVNVVEPHTDGLAKTAEHSGPSPAVEALLAVGSAEGYAFWYGNAMHPTLAVLALDSPFEQLAVVDSDASRVAAFRQKLDEAGLHGRLTGHVSTPEQFRAPSYVGHMVFVASELATDEGALRAIYESVRPYGGVMAVITQPQETPRVASRLQAMELEQAEIAIRGEVVVVRRAGALPGSADWTHQYGDVANTIKSDDQRVKLPLGVLWFGGSSNMDVLPRHGHGPPEQVVGGRLFIQGMNRLSARDVYTGRVLWKRDFEDLGTYDVYYDETYEDVPLDTKYNQVHIPGANGRGTNYVVTEDRIYILEGATCLMLDPATGETLGKVNLPIDAEGNQPQWGYLGIYQDMLLGGLGFANYRSKHDLNFESDNDLKKNRAGFGSKSFDLSASRALVAFDRHSGEQLWQVDANHSFWHNGIVAGSGRIYCLDKNPTQIEEAMRRRGLSLPDSYRIVCLDAHSGAVDWEIKQGVFGTWLGYSEQHDLLLQAGAQGSDRLYSEVGQGMRVYHADSGKLKWKNDTLKYAGPCILHNDLIVTNANSYSESAGAFYLTDGKQKMVNNPVTGEQQPWMMTRAYGCNNIIASENLLTFRSGAAGFYDLLSDSGTGNLGGFKSGCTSNLVVANGVLNAPDYTRTCSCGYQNQTSLALVHMPDIDVWSVSALAASDAPEQAIQSLGINFGAPGDRRDDQGTLWLEYPIVAGSSPPLSIEFNPEASFYQQHSSTGGDTELSWIAASGIDQLQRLSIELDLSPKLDLADGLAVESASDDAEESASGEVSLSSSDLELVEDGSTQVVGLRFNRVPLKQGAKIQKAYLQFTCDEASEAPTQLMLAGELSPNAQPFEAVNHDISSRTRTEAEVLWSAPAWSKPGEHGPAQATPDLTRLVQEIVNQPDWRADNSLAFIISGAGKRVAVASTGKTDGAAKLVVIAGEADQDSLDDQTPSALYDLQLVVANRRGAAKRVFDVLVQGQVVARDVTVPANTADGAEPILVTIEGIEARKKMELEFRATQGTPILSGLQLTRATPPGNRN